MTSSQYQPKVGDLVRWLPQYDPDVFVVITSRWRREPGYVSLQRVGGCPTMSYGAPVTELVHTCVQRLRRRGPRSP